ncbi:MAG: Omp28-related outer membrane protein [Crocinitomicaceae bacterium]|nr:Omp28-related outer membrane protein [Crocinitomicaceae bacterium]MDG1777653.1 Omp28-related outer membrane protein [Crocinitomicaceae bacterium]
MKKITYLLSAVLFASSASAQIFTDDFEGYASGDYIGPASTEWTTWSGAEGGAEDVQVTTNEALSGTNSIYFSSTATSGGPQDVVLDFGQQYNDGIFTYESAFFIEAGKNAYFNFQATPVIGTIWAMNVNAENGMVSIDDGISPNPVVGSYTDETWFTLKIEANLTTGRWSAYIDGACIGVWTNGVGSIASCDLYPVLNSGFYVDDVMFDHVAYTLPTLNASVNGMNMGGVIAGVNVYPTVTVANAGTTTINSFDVTIDYNGTQYTENITGQSLASLGTMDVTFTSPILLVAGQMAATPTVSNVNGTMNDDDATDDSACGEINPVVPAPGKIVVGEEATGTWCQWCPRGTVAMDNFANDFGPYWAGIAVHNGDPMTDAVYDAGIGTYISGYPKALVDRGPQVDPGSMMNQFLTRLQVAPTALITNISYWDPATRVLDITVTADFQAAADNTFKLACAITEDGVTGTGSGYSQSNAYAGGGNGVMGGFELLSNPVPAASMVYDHVARGIQPSFFGDANSFPAVVNVGEQHSKTFTFTLPADWNEDNIHIIGMLIDPNGNIDNAGKNTIANSAGLASLNTNPVKSFNLFPNPTSTSATVEIIIENDAEVQLAIFDMTGKEITAKDYGTLTTTSTVNVNTSSFEVGVYIVELTVNNVKMTKRLIVK